MKDIKGKEIKVGDIIAIHAPDLPGVLGEIKKIYKQAEGGCTVQTGEHGKVWVQLKEIEVIGTI